MKIKTILKTVGSPHFLMGLILIKMIEMIIVALKDTSQR